MTYVINVGKRIRLIGQSAFRFENPTFRNDWRTYVFWCKRIANGEQNEQNVPFRLSPGYPVCSNRKLDIVVCNANIGRRKRTANIYNVEYPIKRANVGKCKRPGNNKSL